MSFDYRFDTPSDLYYSDFENFKCPYNHQCDDCEYDCEDDDL